MSRIVTTVTNLLGFIITTLFLLTSIGFLIAAPPGHRPVRELTLVGVALIAFLLAALLDVLVQNRAQAAEPPAPVEVRLEQRQVELMAEIVDALVAAHRNGKQKVLIPHVEIPPPYVAETKLPRHRAQP